MGKLFYGTMTGHTASVAESIQAAMPDLIDEVRCIDRVSTGDFGDGDFFVLGGSTWGDGELTDDWMDFLPQLDTIDFSGKTVALFALGDQVGYTYNFVSAMKILYDKLSSLGARIIAQSISVEGFDFSHSESVVDGQFIGLVVDEVNEPDLTPSRIEVWTAAVKSELLAAV